MSDETKQSKDIGTLYRRAFEEFGPSALRSSKPVSDPTPDDALAITYSLRVEVDLNARRLAEQIERACRATRQYPTRRYLPRIATLKAMLPAAHP